MKKYEYYDVRPVKDLKEMLNTSARLYADSPLFYRKVNPDAPYTPIDYKTYKNDVDNLGTALINSGLSGKRIALISDHRYEWAVTYLGVVNGVGIIVPLDKELPPHEIKNMLEVSEASAVIFSEKLREKVEEAAAGNVAIQYLINMDSTKDNGNWLSFDKLLTDGRRLINEGNTIYIDAAIDPEVMSIILFTSATTSTPKGAMLSHKNITSNIAAVCRMIELKTSDTMLSILPIHHTYECTCGFLANIYMGSSVAFSDGLRHIPKNMLEAKPSVMLCVPLMLESMYKKIWDSARKTGQERKLKIALTISNFLRKFGIDIRKKTFSKIHENFGGRLRFLVSGAAPVDPVTMKGLRDFGILALQGYGLTECSPILTANREFNFRDASAGIVAPCCELKIDDPNSSGVGEILAKGDNIMLGYYKDDEANRKAFDNGWFRTGDLGYFDKDGFLYITGRAKNVIITKNGKNVYPEEIEMLLNKSPIIKESLVFGKDAVDGSDIVLSARVVPDSDTLAEIYKDQELTKENIEDLIWKEIKKVNALVVSYKHIKDFTIQNTEFEKTTTKKIKRYIELSNKR